MLFLVLPEYIMANHHSRIETNKHMIHISAITTTPTQKNPCLLTHTPTRTHIHHRQHGQHQSSPKLNQTYPN